MFTLRRSSLSAIERLDLRKSTTKKLRAQGNLPATVYGKGESKSIMVKGADFAEILKQPGGRVSLIDLTIGDGPKEDLPVMIKSTQINPVSRKIIHIDFHRVSLKEKVNASIPINVVGEAAGIVYGGMMEQVVDNIDIRALPTDIPPFITVDVTALELGDRLLVSDLELPEDVELIAPDMDTIVVSVRQPSIQTEPTETEEEAAEEEASEEETEAADETKDSSEE